MTVGVIDRLAALGIRPDERLVELDNGRLFSVNQEGDVREVFETVFTAKESILLNTLSGFIDYVIANLDRTDEPLIVQVKDEKNVRLLGLLQKDGSREILAKSSPIVPDFRYGLFMDSEEFIINFQSKFIENEDRNILLQVMGNVVEENVKNTGDDGISQAISIRQGVASKADVKVPNPVTLKPYRTFLEVEQPESQFIFRMKDGPTGAIFEADGGIWRNKAVENIKEFLIAALEDEINSNRITILA